MMVLDLGEIVLDDGLLVDDTDLSKFSSNYNDEIVEILLDDGNNYSITSSLNYQLGEFQLNIESFITNILLVSISDKFSIGDMGNYLVEKNQVKDYIDFLCENIEIILFKANYFSENNIDYNKSSLNVFFALIRLQFINRGRTDLIEEISDKILEIDTLLNRSDFKNYSQYMLSGNEKFLVD